LKKRRQTFSLHRHYMSLNRLRIFVAIKTGKAPHNAEPIPNHRWTMSLESIFFRQHPDKLRNQ
jgi:hypothetical protein